MKKKYYFLLNRSLPARTKNCQVYVNDDTQNEHIIFEIAQKEHII